MGHIGAFCGHSIIIAIEHWGANTYLRSTLRSCASLGNIKCERELVNVHTDVATAIKNHAGELIGHVPDQLSKDSFSNPMVPSQ